MPASNFRDIGREIVEVSRAGDNTSAPGDNLHASFFSIIEKHGSFQDIVNAMRGPDTAHPHLPGLVIDTIE